MTETVEGSCLRVFARHETFHPRYGWLRKAVEAVTLDEAVFTADDSTVKLGVGKNMVRSIRYWASAASLIRQTADSTSHHVREEPTLNGNAIFGPRGADPYLEASGTLWLVHWWLLRPVCQLPVWWIAFNRFRAVEFTEPQLVEFVADEIGRSSWDSPMRSSIEKDVSCLLRTYAAVKRGRAAIDDLLDCPLRNLGLIEETSPDRFRFSLGRKPGMPAEIVLFAAVDWMAMQESGALTVSVSRLLNELGSPARVFKLNETALCELLEEAVARTGIGAVTTGASARQLVIDLDLNAAREKILKSYYKRVHLSLQLPIDPSNRVRMVV